jgi:hypothetical protein
MLVFDLAYIELERENRADGAYVSETFLLPAIWFVCSSALSPLDVFRHESESLDR